MKTILVVEDEPQIARIAADYLQRAGFDVVTCSNGASALELARARHPALVVLDLGLPRVDGVQVAKTLRAESNVPIIMLTARVEESDRLLGLEIGADDYITKPFSPRELVARVQTVLRRAGSASTATDVMTLADVTLDTSRLKVMRAGKVVELTATEFQILVTMARQPGRVFTRAQLLDAVKGTAVDSFDRAIDTHIKNIRRKLEADQRNPQYIETVYGIGYRCAEQ